MQGFLIQETRLDTAALRRELEARGVGAVVCFEGRVRNQNDGRGVDGLSYEAYAALANAEGGRIVAEVRQRFNVERAVCVHRVGDLAVGEVAVWAGVAAGHRGDAFGACRYLIDEVKVRVPIWKREHYVDGPSEWLHPHVGTS